MLPFEGSKKSTTTAQRSSMAAIKGPITILFLQWQCHNKEKSRSRPRACRGIATTKAAQGLVQGAMIPQSSMEDQQNPKGLQSIAGGKASVFCGDAAG